MSASLQTIPWSTGRMLFKCSACHSHIPTENDRKEDLKFCWHCGEKFGPEPKQEPTEGEWYALGNIVNARRSYGYTTDAVVAEVVGASPEQQRANVNLLAASKKLLAALKMLVATRGVERHMNQYDPNGMAECISTIADAEKGKQ